MTIEPLQGTFHRLFKNNNKRRTRISMQNSMLPVLTLKPFLAAPQPHHWPSVLNPEHAARTDTFLSCGISPFLQSASINHQSAVPSATSLPPSEHLESCRLQPWPPCFSLAHYHSPLPPTMCQWERHCGPRRLLSFPESV